MSDGPLNPTALLSVLSECGVDYVVIGAMAVGVHADVRATGDVDVMVPAGDEANRHALGQALQRLGAARIPVDQGGLDPAASDRYPTVMFRTRYGKLDVLYRPDDSYAKIKQRALQSTIGGQPVRVVGRADLINMKLAAGRPNDLTDVANLTAAHRGSPRAVLVAMPIAADVDEDWACDLALSRAVLFDPNARASSADGQLKIAAQQAQLTDEQITRWAHAVAERLHGADVLAYSEAVVEIDGVRQDPPSAR